MTTTSSSGGDALPPFDGVVAVLLDLDGTLVDALSGWHSAFAVVWPRLTAAAPSLAPLATGGQSDTVYDSYVRRYMHEALQAAGDGEWSDEYVRAGFRELLARHAGRADSVADEAAAAYIGMTNDLTDLYPDAAPALEVLRGRFRLGLISNGLGRDQRAKIARCGIGDAFEVIVISQEVALRKPDPAIFRYALERMGVGPEVAIYAGDNASHDVAGAQAAGVASVWVNRTQTPYEGDRPPTAVVQSLAELPALLGIGE
jgi:HAD superfamily hydrolase (TIGR01549 family)